MERSSDVQTAHVGAQQALRLLFGVPVGLDVAVKGLRRGGGVYGWWAAASVFPDLPGPPNPQDSSLRLLYVGRATSLRGRVMRNHLRRSGQSTLRRTLAGLLVSEGYRTAWTNRVVLVAQDEVRLTAWMHAHLRLTWAEDPEPVTIEAELVRRLHPPLNVHGVDPEHLQAAVVAAKHAYNTASGPAESSPASEPEVAPGGRALTPGVCCVRYSTGVVAVMSVVVERIARSRGPGGASARPAKSP
ncbi:hypothetical protein GCM10010201_34840 [Pilimelia columellifera subsp. columellifera]|uniref:GIY-YIG catalytic domain-containing protein n=1 Tax=Pilimelia columellifera subsp. columellifera TaxID=706583 RepID=A0ABN3NSX6_9ACTN